MKNIHKIAGGLLAAVLLASPAVSFASTSITLLGSNPVTILQGSPFVEPGFSAFSTVDGDITSLVITSSVNTGVSGFTSRSYSVTDSAFDSATAERSINVLSLGMTQPYCSSPSAPGWNVSLPGGGCGGKAVMLASGHSAVINGVLHKCPDWYGQAGCLVN